jgi:hypothetical protein
MYVIFHDKRFFNFTVVISEESVNSPVWLLLVLLLLLLLLSSSSFTITKLSDFVRQQQILLCCGQAQCSTDDARCVRMSAIKLSGNHVGLSHQKMAGMHTSVAAR